MNYYSLIIIINVILKVPDSMDTEHNTSKGMRTQCKLFMVYTFP